MNPKEFPTHIDELEFKSDLDSSFRDQVARDVFVELIQGIGVCEFSQPDWARIAEASVEAADALSAAIKNSPEEP
mgnify:CR=1 FL=1